MKPEVLKFDFKQQLEKPDTLELYIYSEVAPDGYDWWSDEAIQSETSANFFREKLSEYSDVKYINLYINSVGGSVIEGYGIYAQLKRHEAYKTVYVDGFAHSIASVIAMAGDKIIMYQNSVMGIHNMMQGCFGNAAEHRQCADNLDRMMEGSRQMYLTRSGGKISLEKLTELLDAETILTAQECLAYGFCDEIADKAADPDTVSKTMQRINADLTQQIKHFQSLRQAFGEAMAAFKTPLEEPRPPVPTPKDPPVENKTLKFFSAFTGGKE